MTDNFTHRNHYLPERYQLGFANDSGRVWIFDRKECVYREGNPVNIAVERDFYTTIDPTGAPSDSIERMLRDIEGKTWPVIDRLDQRAQNLSEEDRAYLALFVAFLKTRTPAFDQLHKNSSDLMLRWCAKAFNPTVERVAESLAQARGEPVEIAEAQEAFEMIHNDKYEVEFPRQNAIKTMLNTAAELGEAIASMDWTIYTCPADCTLVTSDNPFVVIPPQDLDLIWSDPVNTCESVGSFLLLLLLLSFVEHRTSSSRGRFERRLISLIFAGRNRIIMIRRELPLTSDASPAEPVA